VPEHLPVVEEVIDPEPVKACPQAWRCIGEEVTEQLDYAPAHFFKRRIVRRKYARRDHPFAAPILAPLCTLQDRCIAAPGLIAAIIVGKYVDHLPLYRQEQIFATRHGVAIPRQRVARERNLQTRSANRIAAGAANDGAVDGSGRRLAAPDLRTHPHRGARRRLCAGG
jgi:transposase